MDKIFTIKDKILLYLEKKGIKKEDFFAKTGIASSNFKGAGMKSELGGDKIVKILTIYRDLSPDWLLIDIGEMLKTNCTESQSASSAPTTQVPDSNGKDTNNIFATQENPYIIDKLFQQLAERDDEIKALHRQIGELHYQLYGNQQDSAVGA